MEAEIAAAMGESSSCDPRSGEKLERLPWRMDWKAVICTLCPLSPSCKLSSSTTRNTLGRSMSSSWLFVNFFD